MKAHSLILALCTFVFLFTACKEEVKKTPTERSVWTIEQANAWQAKTGWMCGSDFIPSTAINQLEMWQAETFDTMTIDKELTWAQDLCMSVMRVYLHHLAWDQDKVGFKQRLDKFLEIADRHHIKIMFVFFDDCWNASPKIGTQPEPVPGKHNSGWVQDPGKPLNADTTIYPLLEEYVKDVMNTFANDDRIVLWDLYNEPNAPEYNSMNLLEHVFQWARQTKATQPITAAIWDSKLEKYNSFQLANSDVISYHNYGDSTGHRKQIQELKKLGRPLVCSEYMARIRNSTFQTILPILKDENVSAINWGFVAGKTNTIYAWDDTSHYDGTMPDLWFHDIFNKDGTFYKKEEVDLIKAINCK